MNSSYLFFNRFSFRNCISCFFCFFLNFIFFSCRFCFFLPDTISIINSCTIFYTALINRFFMIGLLSSLRLCGRMFESCTDNIFYILYNETTAPSFLHRLYLLLLFHCPSLSCLFYVPDIS